MLRKTVIYLATGWAPPFHWGQGASTFTFLPLYMNKRSGKDPKATRGRGMGAVMNTESRACEQSEFIPHSSLLPRARRAHGNGRQEGLILPSSVGEKIVHRK